MARLRSIPEVPMGIEPYLRLFLQSLRDYVIESQGSISPPEPVENFRVTPVAGGNQVEFTRSNAELYVLHWNTVNDFGSSFPIGLRQESRYVHFIGAGAITIFYWVEAKQFNGLTSVVGPVSGTTLALGTSITPPAPVTPGIIPYQQEGGGIEYGKGGAELPSTV